MVLASCKPARAYPADLPNAIARMLDCPHGPALRSARDRFEGLGIGPAINYRLNPCIWGNFHTGASQTCIIGYRIDLLIVPSVKPNLSNSRQKLNEINATYPEVSTTAAEFAALNWTFPREADAQPQPTPNSIDRKYGWSTLQAICDQASLIRFAFLGRRPTKMPVKLANCLNWVRGGGLAARGTSAAAGGAGDRGTSAVNRVCSRYQMRPLPSRKGSGIQGAG
jgi:hypothetical protein